MTLLVPSRAVRSLVAAAALVASAGAFAAAPAGTYKVDAVHSGSFFEVGHLCGVSRFMGRFKKMSGELQLDAPEKSSIKVDIKTDSVDSNNDALDKLASETKKIAGHAQ